MTQTPDSPRRMPSAWWRRRPLLWGAGVLSLLGIALAAYMLVLVRSTPDFAALQAAQQSRPSLIVASGGERIGDFSAAGHLRTVSLDQVSPELVNALIATEDRRFYEHHGIDARRIVSAAWSTLTGEIQGASTLTQQLARNLFPREIGNRRSIDRKLREAITALRIEQAYSKRQILESYLNSTPFLYNVRGIDMAARTYFNKPAAQLDVLESATLVGMLKGNHRYNPVRHPERALARRNVVLSLMVREGMLDEASYERVRGKPLALDFRRPDAAGGLARHFIEQVRDQVNEWADAQGIDLDTDGLTVETTLDLNLQRFAEEALGEQVALMQRVAGLEWSQRALQVPSAAKVPEARTPFAYFWQQHPELLDELARSSEAYRTAGGDAAALAQVRSDAALMQRLRDEKTRLSAGFVALEPVTGEVKAWVGSPDFAREPFDHVSQARRQPGSTFKPFVYGAALAKGLSSGNEFIDEPVHVALPDGGSWSPTDAGGPTYDVFTMRQGLAQSRNGITAQVAQIVGTQPVIDFAQAVGVRQSTLEAVPSLALGTSPVTLLEMADAYATLASMGERQPPRLLRRIVDRSGQVLATFEPAAPERAVDRRVAEQLVDMMRGVIESGTGSRLRTEFGVRGDFAGKTGTTQHGTDGWFLAMQPGLVAGAWVGFNDQRVTWRSNWWGQGGHNALRIVGDFYRRAQRAQALDFAARFPDVERPEPMAVDASWPVAATQAEAGEAALPVDGGAPAPR
ncbi:transglycosylase domain-containing protein [Aquincola sp. MAHUQ-54]|uniref:Transglycosylase domain-containing protein n=1 Tax=Aquincola agrisoli TaxID=3119538 RepID=A0AAW9Q546_9BURK